MKILILSMSHPYKTAGIVALNLCKNLSEKGGHEVTIFTKKWDHYQDRSIVSIQSKFDNYWEKIRSFPVRVLNKLNRETIKWQTRDPIYFFQGSTDQTITYYRTQKILKCVDFCPDYIIVAFMPSFVSFKNLYELNQITNAPILLYMMDMAPMTGGCHYAWDCKGYHQKCGNCPGLFSKKENDQTRINWEFKKKYINLTNLIVIAGTEYQNQQLKKCSLYANKRQEKILLSVDPDIYKPADKSIARSALGLPINKKLILIGSVSLSNKRKGFRELVQSLSILKTETKCVDIHVAVAGNAETALTNSIPFKFNVLGYLNHEELIKAYQAADIFLCPSIEDSGPMMINQSIMCGTPVVAFNMGVALDLVISGKTGYRAELKNIKDFAKGIEAILQLKPLEYNEMCNNCRELALKNCSPEIQVSNFSKLMDNY